MTKKPKCVWCSGTKAWARVKRELDKCEMLCLNCHAEEHHPDLSNAW